MIALAQDIGRRGDPVTAATLYERAAQVAQDPVGSQVRLGESKLGLRDPAGAAVAFRAALDHAPTNARAMFGLGTAQLYAGEVESAARSLAAVAPSIDTTSAFNRLGTAQILAGDGAGAQIAFARAAELEPDNLDTLSNQALAHALSGNFEAGHGILVRVLESPRAEPRHFLNLMLILTLAGRDAEAAAVNAPDMSDANKRAFLTEARRVRTIGSPAERARAIGLLVPR